MRYGIMRCEMTNQMIYATALLVLAIPGLLAGARPVNADTPPNASKIGQTWTRPKDGAVTVAQYRKFCKATGRKMPPPPKWGWKDHHPIVYVTWPDAKAYAHWAGAPLPTEAQWERSTHEGASVRTSGCGAIQSTISRSQRGICGSPRVW